MYEGNFEGHVSLLVMFTCKMVRMSEVWRQNIPLFVDIVHW